MLRLMIARVQCKQMLGQKPRAALHHALLPNVHRHLEVRCPLALSVASHAVVTKRHM